MLKSIV